jgi:predicted N-acyltransferase
LGKELADMNREEWDALQKAPEVAELVEDWRLSINSENSSTIVGYTPHAGGWHFTLTRYLLGLIWAYIGTASTGEFVLTLPAPVADRIWEHAAKKTKP